METEVVEESLWVAVGDASIGRGIPMRRYEQTNTRKKRLVDRCCRMLWAPNSGFGRRRPVGVMG